MMGTGEGRVDVKILGEASTAPRAVRVLMVEQEIGTTADRGIKGSGGGFAAGEDTRQ